jgi:hypothetical protein
LVAAAAASRAECRAVAFTAKGEGCAAKNGAGRLAVRRIQVSAARSRAARHAELSTKESAGCGGDEMTCGLSEAPGTGGRTPSSAAAAPPKLSGEDALTSSSCRKIVPVVLRDALTPSSWSMRRTASARAVCFTSMRCTEVATSRTLSSRLVRGADFEAAAMIAASFSKPPLQNKLLCDADIVSESASLLEVGGAGDAIAASAAPAAAAAAAAAAVARE